MHKKFVFQPAVENYRWRKISSQNKKLTTRQVLIVKRFYTKACQKYMKINFLAVKFVYAFLKTYLKRWARLNPLVKNSWICLWFKFESFYLFLKIIEPNSWRHKFFLIVKFTFFSEFSHKTLVRILLPVNIATWLGFLLNLHSICQSWTPSWQWDVEKLPYQFPCKPVNNINANILRHN